MEISPENVPAIKFQVRWFPRATELMLDIKVRYSTLKPQDGYHIIIQNQYMSGDQPLDIGTSNFVAA